MAARASYNHDANNDLAASIEDSEEAKNVGLTT